MKNFRRQSVFSLRAAAAALALAALLGGCAQTASSSEVEAEPTATPTAAPTPTPTPTLSVNPLTGETGTDYAGTRPIAVALRTRDGSEPLWGIASADVLIEGVSEGTTAGLTAVFSSAGDISKAGPVGEGRDLFLQLTLPLNAIPVHINKNVYASNLLNTLSYQDLDGYHIGTAAFAFDQDRQNAGYLEENCWYTTADLVRAGLDAYGLSQEGETSPLFQFGTRTPAADDARNAADLTVTFSADDASRLVYNTDTGLYELRGADDSPAMDADNGTQAAFTNVLVLYASSGVKDDGYTRQYDMTGGTGLYLYGGAWEQIYWTKEDATAPLNLTTTDGSTLIVAQGKSYLAVWGGYYGQALRLLGADGAEQTLPEKPALLESGISDEAAAAAEAEFNESQRLVNAQAAVDTANADLPAAQEALQEAQAALDADPENADLIAKRDECQATVDTLNQSLAENQAILDAAGITATPTPDPAAVTEVPVE